MTTESRSTFSLGPAPTDCQFKIVKCVHQIWQALKMDFLGILNYFTVWWNRYDHRQRHPSVTSFENSSSAPDMIATFVSMARLLQCNRDTIHFQQQQIWKRNGIASVTQCSVHQIWQLHLYTWHQHQQIWNKCDTVFSAPDMAGAQIVPFPHLLSGHNRATNPATTRPLCP